MCVYYIKHFIIFLYCGKITCYFISDCCCNSTSSCGVPAPLWFRGSFPRYVHNFCIYLLLLWHLVGLAVFCAGYFLCHQCEYLIFNLLNSLVINMHMLYTEVKVSTEHIQPKTKGVLRFDKSIETILRCLSSFCHITHVPD